VELKSVGAAVEENALGLPGGRLGRVHRQRTDVAREAIGIFRAEFGEAVIGDAREFRRRIGGRHRVERRQAK
jgi:hypothetical protein